MKSISDYVVRRRGDVKGYGDHMVRRKGSLKGHMVKGRENERSIGDHVFGKGVTKF
jgi:hypothetical protein